MAGEAVTDAEAKSLLGDRDALALTLWGEARSEEVEGRVFVGSVIRNRVRSERFPSTFKGVCHQRLQFSCWSPAGGEGNYAAVMEKARELLEVDHAVRATTRKDLILEECRFLADGIINGQLRDRGHGALFYYAPSAMRPKGSVPKWAAGKRPIVEVGGHLGFVF